MAFVLVASFLERNDRKAEIESRDDSSSANDLSLPNGGLSRLNSELRHLGAEKSHHSSIVTIAPKSLLVFGFMSKHKHRQSFMWG